MRELIERNELQPERDRQLPVHHHRGPRRRVPRGRRAPSRPRLGAAALLPRDPGAGLDGAGDPGAGPLLRARRATSPPTPTSARPRTCAPTCTPRSSAQAFASVSDNGPMTVTFAEKLARMPGYQAGVPTGQAPEAIASGGIAQLASNESPFPPHPKVVEAIQARGRGDEPLPGSRRDPAAPAARRALRDRARPGRGRQRLLRDPARRRRGALRARAPRSSTPGRRSRCTRTWRR